MYVFCLKGKKEYQDNNNAWEITNQKSNSDKTSMDKATSGDNVQEKSDRSESVHEPIKVDSEEPKTEQDDFLLIGSDILIGAPPVNQTRGYTTDRKETAIDKQKVEINGFVVRNVKNIPTEEDQYSSSFEFDSSDDE